MGILDFVIATLVLKMKEIVIPTMNVKATNFVDQTIVQLHLALILMLIVVLMQYPVQIILIHIQVMQKRLGF